jgi:hypothetical protein
MQPKPEPGDRVSVNARPIFLASVRTHLIVMDENGLALINLKGMPFDGGISPPCLTS